MKPLPVPHYMRTLLERFKVWLVALVLFATPAQAEMRILMLGDSITAGYGLPSPEALPNKLEQAIQAKLDRNDIRLINAGVSGDTSAGGLARIEWLLAEKPDAVIVALGANDTLRGLSPKDTHANLDQILQITQKHNLPTLLIGMRAPRNLGDDYTQRFDDIFADLMQKHAVLFYPFLLEGVATNNALNQPDGIHPNPKGIQVIIQGLLPKLRKLVEWVSSS